MWPCYRRHPDIIHYLAVEKGPAVFQERAFHDRDLLANELLMDAVVLLSVAHQRLERW